MQFIKKPVIIEAVQWFKYGDHPDVHAYISHSIDSSFCKYCKKDYHVHGYITTLEGGHIVCPGDWIITGVKGEVYPCKPDIFKETYELKEI